MPDNPDSLKLLADFTDIAKNYEGNIEGAEGICYRRLSEAQRFFMNNIQTTKVTYDMILFPSYEQYQLPAWIGSLTGEYKLYDANGNVINPPSYGISGFVIPHMHGLRIELPRTTTGGNRFVRVFPGVAIQGGWHIKWEAWLRCIARVNVINRQTAPVIEKDYWDLLVDWALEPYRVTFAEDKKGSKKQVINMQIKDKATIIADVQRTKATMYSLNNAEVMKPSGWN